VGVIKGRECGQHLFFSYRLNIEFCDSLSLVELGWMIESRWGIGRMM